MDSNQINRVLQSQIIDANLGLPRKAKSLQLGRGQCRISDLKVSQLATILAQTHSNLTCQTLFAMGGELLEVHKKHLSTLKLQDTDGTEIGLQARIRLSQQISWAEKAWMDRLLLVLSKGRQAAEQLCVELSIVKGGE